MSYQSYANKERDVQRARAEYHEILEQFNRPAPTPFPDEDPNQYRHRVLPVVQSVVPGFENLKIDEYLREPNFNFIEKQIFEAARKYLKRQDMRRATQRESPMGNCAK
jgi:hypothetical protein